MDQNACTSPSRCEIGYLCAACRKSARPLRKRRMLTPEQKHRLELRLDKKKRDKS